MDLFGVINRRKGKEMRKKKKRKRMRKARRKEIGILPFKEDGDGS